MGGLSSMTVQSLVSGDEASFRPVATSSGPLEVGPTVYAFDVDDTLEVSRGPVTLASLVELYNEGNILGVCGNFAMVTLYVPGWHRLFSFIGPISLHKADFLACLKAYIPAKDYVMVGNGGEIEGQSRDQEAAHLAGWRFLFEQEFASGKR